jgi:hypothetical protein
LAKGTKLRADRDEVVPRPTLSFTFIPHPFFPDTVGARLEQRSYRCDLSTLLTDVSVPRLAGFSLIT